ncbi:MAG: hypothetical protein R2942_19000 [Ignavibacteria bacterium]
MNTKIFKPAYLIILLATMIVFQIISDRSVFPNVPLRMQIQNDILSGEMEPPYQYRIIMPLLGYSLQQIIVPFISNPVKVHTLSYQIILFFCFFGIFYQFYIFLKRFFTDQTCMLGILLLAIVIPLGITSYWEDGDYYTLFFYALGLNLIFDRKDYYLNKLKNGTPLIPYQQHSIITSVNKDFFRNFDFILKAESLCGDERKCF